MKIGANELTHREHQARRLNREPEPSTGNCGLWVILFTIVAVLLLV